MLLYLFYLLLHREVEVRNEIKFRKSSIERQCPLGQTDPEEKSSADDREVYKGTPREETAIKNENLIKNEENRKVFNLDTLSNT